MCMNRKVVVWRIVYLFARVQVESLILCNLWLTRAREAGPLCGEDFGI